MGQEKRCHQEVRLACLLDEGAGVGAESGGRKGQIGRTCDRPCRAAQLTADVRVEEAGRRQGQGHGWCWEQEKGVQGDTVEDMESPSV